MPTESPPRGRVLKILLILVGVVFVAFAGLLVIGLLLPTTPEPRIVSVEFPERIPLGEPVDGTVNFEDDQGDVTEVHIDELDVPDTDVLDLRALGSMGVHAGGFTLTQLVEKDSQVALNRITLVDAEGHRSVPYIMQFRAGDPDVFYDEYDRQQAQALPADRRVMLHVFVFSGTRAEIEQGAVFADDAAAAADVGPAVRRMLAASLLPHLTGMFDQCGVGFDLAQTKVIRAAQVRAGDRALSSLFGTESGEGVFLIPSGRVGLPLLNDALPALGVGPGEYAVFVTGDDVWNQEKGVAQAGVSGGRATVVSWRHVHFLNEEMGEIVLPKRTYSTIAHELGHDFGLRHPVEEGSIPRDKFTTWNLMVEKDLGSELLPEQCRIVARELGG